MADQSDIVAALTHVAAEAAYPGGNAGVNAISPITGKVVKVFGGWPIPASLDADMKAGICNVSVFPRPEERNTSRLYQPILPLQQATAGTVLTVVGTTVIVSGTPVSGETLGVSVNGRYAGYGVKPVDTLSTIAAGLAAEISLFASASSIGATISIPAAFEIKTNVQGLWTVVTSLRRQEKLFQITIWAPKYDKRDQLAAAVDAALSVSYRLALPDGTYATTRYQKSLQIDADQKVVSYQRHLFYYAEWATVLTGTTPAVSAPIVNSSGA